MPFFTLSQSAKEAGKAKSTILNSIRNGRLSASKDDFGNYRIDAAELFRVYPIEQSTRRKRVQKTDIDHNETVLSNMLLEQKMQFLEERINKLEHERDDFRNQRDDFRNRLDLSEKERCETQKKLTALLTHQSVSSEQKKSTDPKNNRLWNKLFGSDKANNHIKHK